MGFHMGRVGKDGGCCAVGLREHGRGAGAGAVAVEDRIGVVEQFGGYAEEGVELAEPGQEPLPELCQVGNRRRRPWPLPLTIDG
jgi:hypothetical protein